MKVVNVNDAIELLNDINTLDSTVLPKLINYRVVCNKQLADHPTVQVRQVNDEFYVGILGILNSIFGVNKDEWGYIMMEGTLDQAGQVTHIERFLINENNSIQ